MRQAEKTKRQAETGESTRRGATHSCEGREAQRGFSEALLSDGRNVADACSANERCFARKDRHKEPHCLRYLPAALRAPHRLSHPPREHSFLTPAAVVP